MTAQQTTTKVTAISTTTGAEAELTEVLAPRVDAGSPRPHDLYFEAKRALDLLGATALLLVTGPLLLAAAFVVALPGGLPVIFSHERAGQDGRMFRVHKFRTMRTDQRLSADLVSSFQLHYKIADDPRITPVGRMLRRTSLDELPQLINVIRGEMSLVGPRPVTRAELDQKYRALGVPLTSVKPGLTGLWQISGRSDLPYEQRMELDREYVRTRSLWRDLVILARTPWAVLTMRGAR